MNVRHEVYCATHTLLSSHDAHFEWEIQQDDIGFDGGNKLRANEMNGENDKSSSARVVLEFIMERFQHF